jgi:hypothetical protein
MEGMRNPKITLVGKPKGKISGGKYRRKLEEIL